MSQLTIHTPAGAGPRGSRRRPMRSERMVALRSTMPVGLVTLRHEVPKRINENEYQHETEHVKETTPKVDSAQRAEHVDTPVRKGGEAQW